MKSEEQENLYLWESMPYLLMRCQLIMEKGSPVDAILLDVNPAFEEKIGCSINEVKGQSLSSIFFGMKGLSSHWLESLLKVSLSEEKATFEEYIERWGGWYRIWVYSDRRGHVVALLENIDLERKRSLALEQLAHLSEKRYPFPCVKENYQMLTDNLRDLSMAKFAIFVSYDAEQENSTLQAISGISKEIQWVSKILGFKLKGKTFPMLSQRIDSKRRGRLICFQSLYEACWGFLSEEQSALIESQLGLGKILMVEMSYKHTIIGDFYLMMPKSRAIAVENKELIELYVNQVGILLARNQIERGLQEREEELHDIIASQSELICRYRPNGTLTFVNEAYCRYFQKKEEELVGKSFFPLVPEEEIALGQEHIASLTQENPVGVFEHQVYLPSGEIRWQQWVDRAFFDERGEVREYQSVGRDTTERKVAELKLLESEKAERELSKCHQLLSKAAIAFVEAPSAEEVIEMIAYYFKELVGAILTTVSIYDHQGKELALVFQTLTKEQREEAEKMLGAPLTSLKFTISPVLRETMLEEIIHRPTSLTEISFGSIPKHVSLQMCKHFSIAGIVALTLSYGAKLMGSAVAILDQQSVEAPDDALKTFAHLAGLALSRKEAEENLTKSRNLMQGVFESIQDGMEVLNLDLAIRQVNTTMSDWFAEHAPLEGKKCFQIYHNRAEPCEPCPVLRCLKSGRMEREEKQILTKYGMKWIAIFSYPLKEPGTTTITGAVKFIRDITPIKKSQAELAEAHQRLLAILDGMEALVFVADQETYEILYINEYGRREWGDTVGQRCWQVFREGESSPCERCKTYELVEAEDSLFHPQKRESYHSNTRRWYEWRLQLIRWFDGRTVILEFATDITERREAEQQLEDYTERLEDVYYQLNEEIDKARRVHERILPTTLPFIEGISIAANYYPAQKLGGDFYDVIKRGNRLVLYLSDVSGHGLDGAMLSVFIKQTIKSYLSFIPPEEISPKKVLEYLAAQFQEENYPQEYFLCIFLVVLDLETMELSYSGAGFHDKPLVQLGDGARLTISSKGLFLSSNLFFNQVDLKENSLILTPGTSIFFTTDGLTEQSVEGAFYRDRLPEVFYGKARLNPHLVAQAVALDFKEFNQGSLQGEDDITFLALQVHPLESEYQQELRSDLQELERFFGEVLPLLADHHRAGLFLTCLHELAANAMEHGNKMDPNKKIGVEVRVADPYIMGVITDEGAGFNWRAAMDKPFALHEEERGRGIAMVKMLADQLAFNKKGNQAMFSMK